MTPRLPELVRRSPSHRIGFDFICRDVSIVEAEKRLADILTSSDESWTRETARSWYREVDSRTLVFGVIAREVEELVQLELVQTDVGTAALRLECLPERTHEAHAAGVAGVCLFAVAAAGLIGWPDGLLPAIAILAGGGLWTDVSRVWAFTALEDELRGQLESVGKTLWPRTPHQLDTL